jgi:hypothetical protein
MFTLMKQSSLEKEWVHLWDWLQGNITTPSMPCKNDHFWMMCVW